MSGKTIAFFPEAAFGPALNSVGIAQAVEKLGHRAVFLCDPGFTGVFKNYNFAEYHVPMSEPMPAEEMAKYWVDFINGHIPNFRKSPYDQIDNYVKDCWAAIVSTATWAQKSLPKILLEIKPDMICVDNVILFPAIKHYSQQHDKPWVRIISCSENEIPDPMIPPHLSGCSEHDKAGFKKFEDHFNQVMKPIHDDFNKFLQNHGEPPYPVGQFFEASPYLNLLLYPTAVKFNRQNPLDSKRFQYLEGCVRKEADYQLPVFSKNQDKPQEKPLLYISFGSLGAGDTALLQRLITLMGQLPYRALVNVGDYIDQYQNIPANVHVAKWFPQPSVIPQVDGVIHHGGNNSFTECLYFGKPAIILPYVWDGHDNATRVAETGHGLTLHRYDWTEQQMTSAIATMLTDKTIAANLAKTSRMMQANPGPEKAAALLAQLL